MTETTPKTDPTRIRSWLLAAVLLTATGVAGVAGQRASVDPAPGPGGLSGASGDGKVAVQVTPDRGAVLRGEDGLVRLELLLRAAEVASGDTPRVPTDLVVVLDRSGSMQGEKIQTARAAVHQLLSQLDSDDRFGLVAFSSDAHVAVPLSHPTPEAFTVMSAAVNGLRAGGGTYMSTGLDQGLGLLESSRAAGRAARLVLISDGLAAEGHAVLRAQARRAAAGEFALSSVGVGADFDETLMSALADEGTGNYYYLDDIRELAGVFRDEFETARETVANGLSVTVAPADGVEVVEAAGYPLEKGLEKGARGVVFRPGSLFSGQERRVWVTLRVPTDRAGDRELGRLSVDYTDLGGERTRIALEALPTVACVEQERDFYASIDEEGWARSVAVEEWGQLQQRVADSLRAGRRDYAVREIQDYRKRNAEINAALAAPSPEVEQKLKEAAELENDALADYDAALPREQLEMLKSLGYSGTVGRRVGARK